MYRVSLFIYLFYQCGYLMYFYESRWGQIAILTAIADYKVSGSKEAESICDRVMPRLQHANGAVVLSAIKVGRWITWKIFCVVLTYLFLNLYLGFDDQFEIY